MTEPFIEARIVGRVHTDVPDAEVPRQRASMESTIEILPELATGLTGIAEYSHLFVLFWMDRSEASETLTCHPRGNAELPRVGVFAARGRNHPNPIGLAVVELLAVEENRLRVRKLDAYDGTPVLDIKPYDHYDQVKELREAQWLQARQR